MGKGTQRMQIVPKIKVTNASQSKATVNHCESMASKKSTHKSDWLPWLLLIPSLGFVCHWPMKGCKACHRRIHSVEPWKVTETMLNPTWATSATVPTMPCPWSATNSGQPPTVSTQDLNLNIWEQKSKNILITNSNTFFHHLFVAFNVLPHDVDKLQEVKFIQFYLAWLARHSKMLMP